MTLEEIQDLHLYDVSQKTRIKNLQKVQEAQDHGALGTLHYIEDEDERNAFKGYFLDLGYMILTWPGEENGPSFEVRWTY